MITRRIQSNSGSKKERTQWQQTNNEKHGMKEDERAQWRLKQGKTCHERKRTGKRVRRQKKNAKNKVGPKLKFKPPLVEAIEAQLKEISLSWN